MSARLQPANHGQHSRTKDWPTESWNVRQNNAAIPIEILTETMFGDMNRQIEQFDVLDNFEIAGRRQIACANVGFIDFIRDLFINTLWGSGSRTCFMCPCCPPRFAFLRRSVFLAGGLTMSLEGDFDEFEESFVAFASYSSNSATRAISSAICLACSATIRRRSAMMSSLLIIHEPYNLPHFNALSVLPL